MVSTREFLDENKGYPIPEHWKKGTIPKGKEMHPVVYVSFEDALKYCEWKTEKEGRQYRLPTEYEWEKAARSTDGRIYPWGDEFDKGKCNCYKSGINDTTSVDKYPDGVSPYGCYDMTGNVWEWVDSWYDENERYRVLRGGSCVDGDQERVRARTGTGSCLPGGSATLVFVWLSLPNNFLGSQFLVSCFLKSWRANIKESPIFVKTYDLTKWTWRVQVCNLNLLVW